MTRIPIHSECLDGEITCFEDYIPNMSGSLNESQVKLLKDELIQLFYFEYKHNDLITVDIRHVHANPTISKLHEVHS